MCMSFSLYDHLDQCLYNCHENKVADSNQWTIEQGINNRKRLFVSYLNRFKQCCLLRFFYGSVAYRIIYTICYYFEIPADKLLQRFMILKYANILKFGANLHCWMYARCDVNFNQYYKIYVKNDETIL